MPTRLVPESSDDDAPDVISHIQSRQDVEERAKQLRTAEKADKEARRARNKARDQRLKVRAEGNRLGKSKRDPSMEHPSPEAEVEAERGFSDSGSEELHGIEEPFGAAESSGEYDGHGTNSGSHLECDDEAPLKCENRHPVIEYLPDGLFAKAFASQPKNRPASETLHDEKKRANSHTKRKRSNASPKDVTVGSRTIRILPRNDRPVPPTTIAPSRKVKKFLDRTLRLKGKRPSSSRGWERRPVNIGVLRREGPAPNFVRSR